MEGKEDHVSVRTSRADMSYQLIVIKGNQGSGGKEESYVFNV